MGEGGVLYTLARVMLVLARKRAWEATESAFGSAMWLLPPGVSAGHTLWPVSCQIRQRVRSFTVCRSELDSKNSRLTVVRMSI